MTKAELIELMKDYADDAVIYCNREGEDYRWNGEYSECVTVVDIEEAVNVAAHAPWTDEPGTIGILIS